MYRLGAFRLQQVSRQLLYSTLLYLDKHLKAAECECSRNHDRGIYDWSCMEIFPITLSVFAGPCRSSHNDVTERSIITHVYICSYNFNNQIHIEISVQDQIIWLICNKFSILYYYVHLIITCKSAFAGRPANVNTRYVMCTTTSSNTKQLKRSSYVNKSKMD